MELNPRVKISLGCENENREESNFCSTHLHSYTFSQIPDRRRRGLSAAPAATMRTLSQCKEATTVTLTEAQPVASSIRNGNGSVVLKEQQREQQASGD